MISELFTFLSQLKQKRFPYIPSLFVTERRKSPNTLNTDANEEIDSLFIRLFVLCISFYKKRAGNPGPYSIWTLPLNNPLCQHRVRNLEEARNIRANHKVILMAIFFRRGGHIGVNINHNIFQVLIHLIK